MGTVWGIAFYVVFAFWLLLIGRFILELIQMFARDWRPTGPILVVAELIYTVTDPPLRALRRVIPPLRLGGVALDIAWMLLFVIVIVLLQVTRALAGG